MEAVQGVGRVVVLDPPVGDQRHAQAVGPIDVGHPRDPDILDRQEGPRTASAGQVGRRAVEGDAVLGEDLGPLAMAAACSHPGRSGSAGRRPGCGPRRRGPAARRPASRSASAASAAAVAEPGHGLVGRAVLPLDPGPVRQLGQRQRPVRLRPGRELPFERRGGPRRVGARPGRSSPSRARTLRPRVGRRPAPPGGRSRRSRGRRCGGKGSRALTPPTQPAEAARSRQAIAATVRTRLDSRPMHGHPRALAPTGAWAT